MANVRTPIYCSRCGDEIPPAELALLQGTTCALCNEMRLEAEMIHAQRRPARKPFMTLVRPLSGNPQ